MELSLTLTIALVTLSFWVGIILTLYIRKKINRDFRAREAISERMDELFKDFWDIQSKVRSLQDEFKRLRKRT